MLSAAETKELKPTRKEHRRCITSIGSKPGVPRNLVATFGCEQQLLAYVRWSTLLEKEGACKVE
jgi:hypothetical protein